MSSMKFVPLPLMEHTFPPMVKIVLICPHIEVFFSPLIEKKKGTLKGGGSPIERVGNPKASGNILLLGL